MSNPDTLARAGLDDLRYAGAAGQTVHAVGEVCREPVSGCEVQFAAVGDAQSPGIRYRARACPHTLAVCEYLARLANQSGEAPKPDAAELAGRLEVPIEKTGRILLVIDALASLYDSLDSGND